MLKFSRLPVLVLAVLLVGACSLSGSNGNDDSGSETDGKPTVEIVGFGVGQSSSSAQGIVIVTTDSEEAIG